MRTYVRIVVRISVGEQSRRMRTNVRIVVRISVGQQRRMRTYVRIVVRISVGEQSRRMRTNVRIVVRISVGEQRRMRIYRRYCEACRSYGLTLEYCEIADRNKFLNSLGCGSCSKVERFRGGKRFP